MYTHIDNEGERFSRMMLDEFLLIGGVKLWVFDIFKREVTGVRFFVFVEIQPRGAVTVPSV